jgi:hypothetical protein
MSKRATITNALLRAARACILEAKYAERRGADVYASGLRASARRALDEIDSLNAAAPRVLSPEAAAAKAQAKAFAQVVLQGFGSVH